MLPQFLSMSEKIVEFTDSTHSIYWPTKGMKNVLEQFTDHMKKAKKVSESWKSFSIKDST